MNKFDFNTIEDFDNHISGSIYGYDLLYKLIISLIDFYIFKGKVYDLGCTTGKLLNIINEKFNIDCIGYDITDSNFMPTREGVKLIKSDITQDLKLENPDVVLSIFTLQFIEYSYRLDILNTIKDALNKTGVFIFCEKERSSFDHKFEFANYQNKMSNFSAEEILEKERKLRTVMHPLYSQDNKRLLKEAGFKFDIFFKSLNFTGYICTK